MKKKLSVLLVAMMALVMALPVMAAPSPVAKGVVKEVKKSVDKNGKEVKVAVRETKELFADVPEEKKVVYQEAVKNVTEKETAKKVVKDAIAEVIKPEEMADFLKEFKTEYKDVEELVEKVEVADVKDVHVEDPDSVEWPLKITFEIPGVTSDSTVMVLHFEGEKWEKVPATILADGSVEAEFMSLSPVAFVVDKATLADADEEVNEEVKEEAPAEEVVEEPAEESSSNTMIYVIVVIAVIAVVAVIFSKKKNK